MVYLRPVCESLHDEVTQMPNIADGDVDLEIVDAADVIDRQYLLQRLHVGIERAERLLGMLDHPDRNESLERDPECTGCDLSVKPRKNPRTSQRLNAAVAARWGKTDACSELLVRQPSILLQRRDYLAIDSV
jgi:hypothetical protein